MFNTEAVQTVNYICIYGCVCVCVLILYFETDSENDGVL